jgi:hypothetical protein
VCRAVPKNSGTCRAVPAKIRHDLISVEDAATVKQEKSTIVLLHVEYFTAWKQSTNLTACE